MGAFANRLICTHGKIRRCLSDRADWGRPSVAISAQGPPVPIPGRSRKVPV